MSDDEEKVSVGSAREPSTPKPQASGRSSPAGTVDADEVATASTVLVLEPSDRVADERTCYSFFAGDRLEEKNVLLVSLNSPADDCIDEFIEHDLPFPRNLGVISTENQLQSTRTETAKSEAGHSVTVQTVSDPVLSASRTPTAMAMKSVTKRTRPTAAPAVGTVPEPVSESPPRTRT